MIKGSCLVVLFCFISMVSGEIYLSDGHFETSFDCGEWEGPSTLNLFPSGCEWMEGSWDYACSDGQYEQITSDANMAVGEGGRGIRHWVGAGKNDNSNSIGWYFSSPQDEMWIRWYMRYSDLFSWNNEESHQKFCRISGGDGGDYIVGWNYGRLVLLINGVLVYTSNVKGHWETYFTDGAHYGNDEWVLCEVHLKYDTDGTDGIFEFWFNENKVEDFHNVNFQDGGAFDNFGFGKNQDYIAHDDCTYNDYDDVFISTAGYIGPVDGAESVCGDNVCNGSETCSSCFEDCGACSICGNSVVESGEDCDDGNLITEECVYGDVNCVVCSSGCLNVSGVVSYCGDGDCDLVNEDSLSCLGDCSEVVVPEDILFFEGFEDVNFASRDWYDAPSGTISNLEYVAGSTSSFECRFLVGGRGCEGGSPARHKFEESESVYLGYWIKYSSNWEGSNRAYHPHMFHFINNLDSDWIGPAGTHLTAYIEENEGVPRLAIQDMLNVDTNCVLRNDDSFVGCDGSFDDYVFSEARSVASCNGFVGEVDSRECYEASPGNWYSARGWDADGVYFSDSPGEYYKNDWHFVEAYFEMNSVLGGIGLSDGKIRYWYDGELLISSDNILLRTGENSDLMFDQFLVAPYIGDGSPLDQTFWVDNLTVAVGRGGEDCVAVAEICGDFIDQDCDGSDLVCVCAHDADLVPCDGVVSVEELRDYIDLWLAGSVNIGDVMGAVVVWSG